MNDKRSHNFIDITGNKYGRLTVISFQKTGKDRSAKWLCKCDCGNECVVDGYRMRSGKTKSCGCLSSETARKKATKHGMSSSRIYSIHNAMNERCFNKNSIEYYNYGGRGIKVCDEWRGSNGFTNFLKWAMENGYSDNLTIDRINVNGNYEPSNCRWITQKAQCNNTRSNIFIEYKGEIHTLTEWAEILKVPPKRINKRLKSGWSVERAFETPKMKNQFA